ncbi:MAG: hypothetical protein IJJ41_08120 [Clostridia bacterium]|nr:hypothetical protein [Clostridia bacterium]
MKSAFVARPQRLPVPSKAELAEQSACFRLRQTAEILEKFSIFLALFRQTAQNSVKAKFLFFAQKKAGKLSKFTKY